VARSWPGCTPLGPRVRVNQFIVQYEPNPNHKAPWQAGRKGSLCPRDLAEDARDRLLAASQVDPTGGKGRYATDGRRAFCAYPHDGDKWHGFPVGWKEVPEALRREWKGAGLVKQTDIRRFWESSEETL
jgi:hypothetical protein